jgi:hypothetical protein
VADGIEVVATQDAGVVENQADLAVRHRFLQCHQGLRIRDVNAGHDLDIQCLQFITGVTAGGDYVITSRFELAADLKAYSPVRTGNDADSHCLTGLLTRVATCMLGHRDV